MARGGPSVAGVWSQRERTLGTPAARPQDSCWPRSLLPRAVESHAWPVHSCSWKDQDNVQFG